MVIDQRHAFYLAQAGVGILFVIFLVRARSRDVESQFRSDSLRLTPKGGKAKGPESLADARLKPKSNARPLALPGIVLNGAPHEILGIDPHANEATIRHAWRELMKRYHPDKLKQWGPNSPEWQEAQKIAEAINRAKDDMIAKKGGPH